MFSNDIVGSDAFLEMSATAQVLYFHLGMRCDDDGFVNPNVTMRMTGANKNDLDLLLVKKFLIQFKNGVVVIKHHRLNNNWDKYNSKRTVYLEEFNQLNIKDNRAYTLDKTQGTPIQSVNSLQPVVRIEENRIDKKRIEESNTSGVPEWVNQEVWKEWEGYRKEKKQKLTPRSVTLQLKFLEKNKDNHVAIIEQSIQNGWTGLFPLKGDNGTSDKPVRVLNFNKK